ncbi:MAG TPA: hypothetical protein VHY84_26205 [Bryobacteraceae bacterium]|nr:hypothetical protein [Bryobacteraceae bacterium]
MMMNRMGITAFVFGSLTLGSVPIAAQWSGIADSKVPRNSKGEVRGAAPTPRTPDGKPDFSGLWMHANSGPPRGRGGRGGGRGGGPPGGQAPGGPGAFRLEAPTPPFPYDPNGPPVAAFFEAGANIEGGLPYTQWARDIKKKRTDLQARENPDANCLPMGFLQFHQQPQPRRIMNVSNPKMILIEYEANNGLRHIYMDGRKLPPQGEPQPWWYGYSVGHWDGDTLIVETNNLRGAEDSSFDGWLDVNGSPYSEQAKFTEKIRRPAYDHLQIDLTLEDPKAYTKPWTVRVDQRLIVDQDLIEFECNENQQFRQHAK